MRTIQQKNPQNDPVRSICAVVMPQQEADAPAALSGIGPSISLEPNAPVPRNLPLRAEGAFSKSAPAPKASAKAIPRQTKASRHPNASITAATGTPNAKEPRPTPASKTPDARPRQSGNHRSTVESTQLAPKPTANPQQIP